MDSGFPGRTAFGDQTFLIGEQAAGQRLREELRLRGLRRVVVFASASARASGVVDEVVASALSDCEVRMWSGTILAHAPIAQIEQIAATLQDDGGEIDALLSIGGGKVVDTAKGVAIVLAEGAPLERHRAHRNETGTMVYPPLSRPKLPIVAVPTTLSGAEVTPGCGLTTDQGRKRIFWDRKISARVICHAPEVLGTVPAEVLTTSGMNALAHCAEAMYSKTSGHLASAFAAMGAEYLASGLLGFRDGPPEALSSLGAGSSLAALAICNARTGLHHAICHVLGGMFKIPHGDANSIVLPHALRFNLPATLPQQERFLRAVAVSVPLSAGATAPDAVATLQSLLGVPTRLREAGIAESELGRAAEAVLDDPARFYNPRDIRSAAEVETVLRAAW